MTWWQLVVDPWPRFRWAVGRSLREIAEVVTRLLVAVLAGWLGLLSPASDVIEGISGIGFIGFFAFMLSMGVTLLRRRATAEGQTSAATR